MYLLDTTVVSEMRRFRSSKADPGVRSWVRQADVSTLYISVITVLEMEIGCLRTRRKDPVQARLYEEWLHDQVVPSFAERILPVDLTVALRCAALHVPVTVAYRDAEIAATAMVHGMTVVTRNVKDFAPMGVRVLNPWG